MKPNVKIKQPAAVNKMVPAKKVPSVSDPISTSPDLVPTAPVKVGAHPYAGKMSDVQLETYIKEDRKITEEALAEADKVTGIARRQKRNC